jgi:general secretion pathway protein H
MPNAAFARGRLCVGMTINGRCPARGSSRHECNIATIFPTAHHWKRPYHQPTQGFTLFEMMVVLVILAMAMTVVPSIMAGLDGSRLRAASDNLVARLRETRSEALRRYGIAELVLDTRKRTYATPAARGVQPLPSIVDAIEVRPQALVQPDGSARIRFGPDGTATQAQIFLRHGGSSVDIAVDWLTGRVHQGG